MEKIKFFSRKLIIKSIGVVIVFMSFYFVFDNLNLKNDNTRKCMIEFRSNISGSYKGYIYCSSLNEANEIRDQVDETLKKKIEKKTPISVKRGCSEYGVAYPEYKKINKNENTLMKYNEEWKEKENLTDIHRSEKNILTKKTLPKSLKGVTVNDVLIMRNWLGYAKKIGDNVIVIPNTNNSLVTPLSESFQSVVWHCLVSHPSLQIISTKW